MLTYFEIENFRSVELGQDLGLDLSEKLIGGDENDD